MEEQSKDEIPLVGMRVKEETPTKIVLEWWDQESASAPNILTGVISFVKGIFSAPEVDPTVKELNKDSVTPAEIITIDFDSRCATRIKKLRSGNTEQTDLDLNKVSRVRIQMEELGHHFRLYLEIPGSEPFQASIAFTSGSYLPDDLIAHARKIGKILNKPVVRQHTDLGNLISEETLQT